MLGREEADTLMAHLPLDTWNEIATKDDVGALGTSLRSEMQAMGAELRGEMNTMGAELRGEMNTMGAELRGEMNTMGSELRSEMSTMRSELRAEMHTMSSELGTVMQVEFATLRGDFIDGTNRQLKWMVTFAAAWSFLLVATVRLIP